MSIPVDGVVRTRPTPVGDDGARRLADRVVETVADVAGGRLRPESAQRLAELTIRGYDLFVATLAGAEPPDQPARMRDLVDGLFDDIEVSLEDAMALHRYLEQVLLREVREAAPAALAAADPGEIEAVAHRFFNDLAAALTDTYLEVRRGQDADREAAEAELLCSLLATPARVGEARRVARLLDVDLDVPWEVAVVCASDGGEVPAATAVTLRRALWGAAVLVGRTPAGLVVAVSRGATSAEWPDVGGTVVCGIGTTHSDVRGLRDSYEEALEALELARRKGLPLLRFADAWFDRFLLGEVSAEELADVVLAPVATLTPNRRAAVLETLEAYLDSGSSVTAVADALHLHRQSVNYRMQNVRRLFGPRLMSANGRLALHIAVKAARLRRG